MTEVFLPAKCKIKLSLHRNCQMAQVFEHWDARQGKKERTI